jgi:hypothetical protein
MKKKSSETITFSDYGRSTVWDQFYQMGLQAGLQQLGSTGKLEEVDEGTVKAVTKFASQFASAAYATRKKSRDEYNKSKAVVDEFGEDDEDSE